MSREVDDLKGIFFLIGLGGYFFWKGFRDLKLQKKVSGLATSRARSMAMGLVELSGSVKAIFPPRLDPVYSSPCCYFQLEVEQYQRSGKSGSWVTIHKDSSDGSPFYCCDSTGKVMVMPKEPDLYLNNRLVCQNGFFGSKNAAGVAFLNSRWGGSLRLTFYVLREGDPLFVIGCALPRRLPVVGPSEPQGTGSLAKSAQELKKNPKAMNDLDTNKDGEVDAQEWEKGVEKYHAFLEAKHKIKVQPQTSVEPLIFEGMVTETKEHDLVFASSEEDLLSKIGPMAYLQIIGGGAGLIFGLIWLLSKVS